MTTDDFDIWFNKEYWKEYSKNCLTIYCTCGEKYKINKDIYNIGINELVCPKCGKLLKSVYFKDDKEYQKYKKERNEKILSRINKIKDAL